MVFAINAPTGGEKDFGQFREEVVKCDRTDMFL